MKETGLQWLLRHRDYSGDDCLTWPLGRDNHGYGQCGHRGMFFKAHRRMCELVCGPCPSGAHQASHSCGNGHLGCVNPRHLSWKTRSENQLDRRTHGTATTNPLGRRGKITPAIAEEIRSLQGRMTQQQIATSFGVSKPTVRRIFSGKFWRPGAHDPSPMRERIIRRLSSAGAPVTYAELIKASGTSPVSAGCMIDRMYRAGKIKRVTRGLYEIAS